MSFLQRILATKRAEIERLTEARVEIEARARQAPPARDLFAALRRSGPTDPVRVIAEVKFRSPSKGPLRPRGDPAWIAGRYQAGGARAISVLCDGPFFDGSFTDLELVRGTVQVPVLCKEFVLDEVQVDLARASGADGVLLIVRILDDPRLVRLAQAIVARGMTPVVEVNGRAELERAALVAPAVVGVNARDLETFEVDLGRFDEVLPVVPRGSVAVAMSGVASAADLTALARTRADAVLIGEHLMRASDPGIALQALLGN